MPIGTTPVGVPGRPPTHEPLAGRCRPAWLSGMNTVEPVLAVDPAVALFLSPAAGLLDVVVSEARAPALDEAIARGEAAMRVAPGATPETAAVRALYRAMGLDPTKVRPSSEALLRRVRKGERLPRINSLVDVVNWCSLETRLPFGLYDGTAVRGGITARLGRPGEAYAGIRKDDVHVGGRLVLADEQGPFGNPTSDSARTMVTGATRRAVIVVFAPAPLAAAGAAALALAIGRARAFSL